MLSNASISYLPSWKRPQTSPGYSELRLAPDVETFGFANLHPNTSKSGASQPEVIFLNGNFNGMQRFDTIFVVSVIPSFFGHCIPEPNSYSAFGDIASVDSTSHKLPNLPIICPMQEFAIQWITCVIDPSYCIPLQNCPFCSGFCLVIQLYRAHRDTSSCRTFVSLRASISKVLYYKLLPTTILRMKNRRNCYVRVFAGVFRPVFIPFSENFSVTK